MKTNFSLSSRSSGETELPPSVITIGDLLGQIGKDAGFIFIDSQRVMLRKDVEVCINGKDISFLPYGLKTILKEGDLVDIALMTLGGG